MTSASCVSVSVAAAIRVNFGVCTCSVNHTHFFFFRLKRWQQSCTIWILSAGLKNLASVKSHKIKFYKRHKATDHYKKQAMTDLTTLIKYIKWLVWLIKLFCERFKGIKHIKHTRLYFGIDIFMKNL